MIERCWWVGLAQSDTGAEPRKKEQKENWVKEFYHSERGFPTVVSHIPDPTSRIMHDQET